MWPARGSVEHMDRRWVGLNGFVKLTTKLETAADFRLRLISEPILSNSNVCVVAILLTDFCVRVSVALLMTIFRDRKFIHTPFRRCTCYLRHQGVSDTGIAVSSKSLSVKCTFRIQNTLNDSD